MNDGLMASIAVDKSKDFEEGLGFLAAKDYFPAAACFMKTLNESDNSVYKNKYLSFLGIAQVLDGDSSGLSVCRGAADQEFYDADVFYNLALAEFRTRHRKKGFQAIIQGLHIDNSHIGLKGLLRRVDQRRSPPLKFLRRDNFINVLIGKASWRSQKKRVKARRYLEQIDYIFPND